MCGRGALAKKKEEVEERFGAKFYAAQHDNKPLPPLYNICPTTHVPIIANDAPATIQHFYWGIDVTTINGELRKNLINARVENILRIPFFAACMEERRCILPCSGYYEWKTVGKKKIPYLVSLKSDEMFSLAGFWAEQEYGKGEKIKKFMLITQPPIPKLTFIHDRMPGILTSEEEAVWLNLDVAAKDALGYINRRSDNEIKYHTVSDKINKSFNNDPAFVVEYRHVVEEQGSLF